MTWPTGFLHTDSETVCTGVFRFPGGHSNGDERTLVPGVPVFLTRTPFRGSGIRRRKLVHAGPARHGRVDGTGRRGHGELLSLLQRYALDRCSWETREELRISIVI